MDTLSWATKFPPCEGNRLRPAGVQRRLLRLRLLQKIIPGCESRFRAGLICVPHPAGIGIHIAPESVFMISRNAYSHAPLRLHQNPRIWVILKPSAITY